MKKIIIIVIAVIAAIFIYRRIVVKSGTPVMGYVGTVTNVENGNVLVLNTGLKVWMLGVEPGHERTAVWIKNNLVGKMVELVSDSGNEQSFNTVGSTVKAYVIVVRNGQKVCANRILLADNRDCSTLAYMKDSSFIAPGDIPVEISDKGLYMKQRTMLVSTNSGGIGTAFFINKHGVALTNHHVLSGKEPACVYLYAPEADDSKIYSSRRRNIRNILWTNEALDITVFSVELEQGESIPYFNLISRHEPPLNECYILGNPEGLWCTAGDGTISAYRKDDKDKPWQVQYNINTNPGNSGGPVMNSKGEIIAVHASGVEGKQGLNFGIDILRVRKILDSPGVDIDYGGK